MATYPPAAGSISGDIYSASRFLANPTHVARRIQELADLRLIGTQLMRGRVDADGGAVSYTQSEPLFADATLEVVAPGGEYTLTTAKNGPAGMAKLAKFGKDTIITDEAVKRANRTAMAQSPVDRDLAKLANSAAQFVDQAAISVINSSVTSNTTGATAQWNLAATETILQDIMLAQAAITGLNMGYQPDTLLVDDVIWAWLASNKQLATLFARETTSNPVYTGRFSSLAGLDVVHVPAGNLPGGVNTSAWVLDSQALGFIATEDLQDGYQQAGEIVETKVMRDDTTDSWRVRARANFVPVVTDPGAIYKISAVA